MATTIYHIATDEKFVDAAHYQFTRATDLENKFFILTKKIEEPLQHVTTHTNVMLLKNGTKEKKRLVADIGSEDIVVFHSLIPWFYDIILCLNENTKVLWMCFGFEIYNERNFFSLDSIYAKLTRSKFIPKNDLKFYIKSIFSRSEKRSINKKKVFFLKKKEAIERVDYLVTSFEEEFEVITKKLGEEKKLFLFWYYPLEQILEVNRPIYDNKSHILVGNSGFPTLNHLDVLKKLPLHEISEDVQVIVPLNYGETTYIEALKKEAEELLGDGFTPLDTFLPIETYNAILQKVKVAVFYNYRQQALGNIIALLYMGAKVYLSSRNPIYHFLVRKGIHVYDFDAHIDTPNFMVGLIKEHINENRATLQSFLSEDVVLEQLRKELKNVTG